MAELQNKGLVNRYIVFHTDGTPVDLNADYFVLRYDPKAEPHHRAASVAALVAYAEVIQGFNPKLAADLWQIAADYTKEK